MASGTTSFEVSFIIGLHGISLGAFLTHPLLVVAVLPSEMLLDSYKISKGVAWVMVQTARLRAHKNPLLHLLCLPLK